MRERLGAVRTWLYEQLEPSVRGQGLSLLNAILLGTILGVVALAAIETEPTVVTAHAGAFQAAENLFGVLFSIEYAARLWIAAKNPRYGPGLKGLIRFVFSPAALFDLAAIIVSFATPTGFQPFNLRIFRMLRVLRVAKLGRLSRAVSHLYNAIVARREELLFSFIIALIFLVLSATMLYIVEGPIQPDKFGSVPRAMWWAVATLTTIGYGDVYPISPLGKFIAAVCAMIGIGLVAIPTGIMAAAFTEAHRNHSAERTGDGMEEQC